MHQAKRFCFGIILDDPVSAAFNLGRGLHAKQDWVAHGDYGFDNPGEIFEPHGGFYDHFFAKEVDDPDYDNKADTAHGRPIKVIKQNPAVMCGPTFPTYYYIPGYIKGRKRFDLTMKNTLDTLKEFREHVEMFGGPCCRSMFLQ